MTLEKAVKNVLKSYKEHFLNDIVIDKIVKELVKRIERLMSGK
jgi:hypothetical protein